MLQGRFDRSAVAETVDDRAVVERQTREPRLHVVPDVSSRGSLPEVCETSARSCRRYACYRDDVANSDGRGAADLVEARPTGCLQAATVGLGGEEFTVYKLRTMLPDRRSVAVPIQGRDRRVNHKSPDDPRHVPLGRFLRKWSLDEIPQFWNVALGDMSLVGPRPELPHVVAKYERWQHRRQRSSQESPACGRCRSVVTCQCTRPPMSTLNMWSLSACARISVS